MKKLLGNVAFVFPCLPRSSLDLAVSLFIPRRAHLLPWLVLPLRAHRAHI
jgi:hypothetical protein